MVGVALAGFGARPPAQATFFGEREKLEMAERACDHIRERFGARGLPGVLPHRGRCVVYAVTSPGRATGSFSQNCRAVSRGAPDAQACGLFLPRCGKFVRSTPRYRYHGRRGFSSRCRVLGGVREKVYKKVLGVSL